MLNKVTLIGRVGQINNIAATNGGTQVINYSLATTKSIKDKVTGQFNDETEWHRLVSFGKCAEHISQKVTQGDLLYLEGELRTRKWEKNGVDHYTTEIVVNDFPRKLPRYFTQQPGAQGQNQGGQQYSPQAQPHGEATQQQYRQHPQNSMDDLPPNF
tara:strand:+ start:10196 stop:10666 length:471 start_codon:yes stop_codon:yes gene_type:complete